MATNGSTLRLCSAVDRVDFIGSNDTSWSGMRSFCGKIPDYFNFHSKDMSLWIRINSKHFLIDIVEFRFTMDQFPLFQGGYLQIWRKQIDCYFVYHCQHRNWSFACFPGYMGHPKEQDFVAEAHDDQGPKSCQIPKNCVDRFLEVSKRPKIEDVLMNSLFT